MKTDTGANKLQAEPRLRFKEYWIFVVPFIITVLLVGIAEFLYVSEKRIDVRRHIGDELLGISNIKVQVVSRWRQERLSDSNFIFHNESIAADVENSHNEAARTRMENLMASMMSNGNYRRIAWLAPDGAIQLQNPETSPAEIKPELLQLARDTRTVVSSNFYELSDGGLHLQLVVPLYSKNSDDTHPAGFIQLVVDPHDGLFDLVQAWARSSRTCEVVLVTREGDDVVFLNELRLRENSSKHLRVPLSESNMPAVKIVLGKEGLVEGTDYRGQPVFAAGRRIPDSPWAIVAKIDQNEVYQDLASEQKLVVLVFILAVVASGTSMLFLLKRVQIRHTREFASKLQSGRALLEAIIEGTSDAIFAKDRDGRYIMINEACARIWGKPRSEIYGKEASFVVSAEEAQEILKVDSQLLSSGEVLTFEEPFTPPGGETQCYLTTKGPILNEAGKIEGVFGISRSITQMKKTEEQLRNFQHAVEQSPVSIVITDSKGTVEYVNQRFTEVTGYSPLEVIGKNPRVLKSGRVKPEVYAQLWQTISAGKEWRGELCNRKKDGSLFWEDALIGPVRDVNGEIQNYIAVKQDMTAHREMEKHLLQAQRMESIGTLAGGIAHDLNNVLAPILISVELLKEREEDDLSRQLLSTVETAVIRGREIIRQVLSFARGMEGEKIQLQPRHVLKEIENILRETFPKSLQIVTDIAPDLSLVSADVTQIHQVLMNLCVNARDAMEAGGTLTLSARNAPPEELSDEILLAGGRKSYVCISVRDTGAGIPAELMDRIFDPFFTTKEVGKGTGLGLSTTYTIVRKHNGFIHVDSSPGHGSEFKIFLPALETQIAPPSTPKQFLQRGHGEGILIVDDEAFVRNVTQQILESFGYKTFVAECGKKALQLYASNLSDIALVITDWMMPEMDGAATIICLRQINPKVRVIVSTGLLEESTQDPGIAQNVCRILNKPYGAQTLLDAIHEVLATSL